LEVRCPYTNHVVFTPPRFFPPPFFFPFLFLSFKKFPTPIPVFFPRLFSWATLRSPRNPSSVGLLFTQLALPRPCVPNHPFLPPLPFFILQLGVGCHPVVRRFPNPLPYHGLLMTTFFFFPSFFPVSNTFPPRRPPILWTCLVGFFPLLLDPRKAVRSPFYLCHEFGSTGFFFDFFFFPSEPSLFPYNLFPSARHSW